MRMKRDAEDRLINNHRSRRHLSHGIRCLVDAATGKGIT